MLELFNLRKLHFRVDVLHIHGFPRRGGEGAYRFYLSEQIQSLFPPVASGWFALRARVRARVHDANTG